MDEIQFKRAELEDKDIISHYFKHHTSRSCERTFANVYLWSRQYPVKWAIVENALVFKSEDEEQLAFAYPAGDPADVRRAIEWQMEFCRKRGVSFQMYNLTPEHFAQLEEWYPGRFHIEYDRDSADYVYESEKLSTLSGKKLHGKRNHINKFKALYPDWSYEPITKENAAECAGLAHVWGEQKGYGDDGEMQAELCVALNFLRLFEELEMRGGILRVNGKIAAFTIGEPAANPDTLLVHVEKALADVQGAYAMISQQFAEHEGAGFTYMNREEDMGEEGLRKAKLSYKPVFLVEKGVVRKRSL